MQNLIQTIPVRGIQHSLTETFKTEPDTFFIRLVTNTMPSTTTVAAAATTTSLSASKTKQEAANALDIYDEIEIEDMTFDKTLQLYHYPCPCGDRFEIVLSDLRDGEDIGVCPSCSLMIRVIFDLDDLPKEEKRKT